MPGSTGGYDIETYKVISFHRPKQDKGSNIKIHKNKGNAKKKTTHTQKKTTKKTLKYT